MTLNSAVSKAVNMQEEDLAGYVIHATKEVFNTMVMLDLEDSYPLREPVTTFHCSVTGMVGLAGTYTGILSIHCPKTFALRITSNMLGMDVADVGEDVNDALGEIANMLGGYVKQILSKGGLDINLSIPTVISGEEYTVNSMSDDNCVIIPFTNEGERFLVALKLRKEG
ncbi:protein phosphoaspartate phosphatase CheX associated with MCPs of classes 40H and 40+24H [Geotalea daltonii FRC-32]|uniref:Protein phosphoaspartate phosphatase CheX associated with MCPs of classes 40H and 40+24H n=1 Tax=Geotalea daltonii (strain DSM 22248 / JCM 15807 / FRC-32) TaxID=316067 RepID=B9LZP3_GEODF|nr:chemotaxis protein CheX [Geotalea daltonii]ACM18857.1 protein phosphoaspartate phosphatase CheX associated with MCPs of classes 40H and 40+24H [Geotalea daltonii FRC-32]